MSSFSPDPVGARKPDDSLPPIVPDSASTRYASSPQRSKIRAYASRCRRNAASRPASSASNVYESFMTNSRSRRRPPRGRGSSRSLVEKWYQTCGSCLYDWISRARKVIDSSCVHESTNGRPPLSSRWKRIGTSMRPVVSHSSAGVSVGARISWPPTAFISSRMICSTRMCTRQPSGSSAHRPAPIWRMKPPRTSSWCEAASASAGASRRVGRKSCEARAIIGSRRTLFERDQGGFRHRQGGRLRHLEALRAVHSVGDPPVDLVEELVDEDVRADLLQHAAVRVDEADVAPAGDAEVRIAGLAGAVDRAAEHGHLEMLRVALQTPLDLFRERVDA